MESAVESQPQLFTYTKLSTARKLNPDIQVIDLTRQRTRRSPEC